MPTFDETLYWVYASLLRAGQPHGPDAQTRDPSTTALLCAEAGIPLHGIPAITVSGSKGKGSTALLAAAMLQALGYRTGLVTSPHLVHFLERIRLNGQSMPETDFLATMEALIPNLERLERELPPERYIGPNGVVLACALRYFAAQGGVDALVLEVGRGGRYDEIGLYANAITCLSPIMAEHLAQIGPTVADVAWHKAGLIRPHTIAVSAPQPSAALAVIEALVTENEATLLLVERDLEWRQATLDGMQTITVTIHGVAQTLELATPAPYQALNAAVAFGGVQALVDGPYAPLTHALRRLRLAGRCDVIAKHPRVLVDGAINGAAAREFLSGAMVISREPITLVTSLPADKDAAGLLAVLAPCVAQIIVTQARNPNLHFDDRVAIQAQTLHSSVMFEGDPDRAFEQALAQTPVQGTIWIVGTQSLVRDALIYWQQTLESIWLP